MKKLVIALLGLALLLIVAYIGLTIYFNTGEAKDPPQEAAPGQAAAPANADSISIELKSALAKSGKEFSEKVNRIIEEAQDSIRDGKEEVGLAYIRNTKAFITDNFDEIQKHGDADLGMAELFKSLSVEDILRNFFGIDSPEI